MILNCGSVFVHSRSIRTLCVASTDQLRQQLEGLQKEAKNTRAKASNSRLRLMRLSEAAEKFRREAAISVRTGKEDEARKLLFQKKKVMQAMEKLKSRIELFDQLAAKLNESISVKERLLIGNIASDIEFNESEDPSPIRIICLKEANLDNDSFENHFLESDKEIFREDEELGVAENTGVAKDLNGLNCLREISSYDDFIINLDQQLNKIEEQLETFLSVSTILLDSKKKPEYLKVQHVTEILEAVRHTRERVTSIMQSKASPKEECSTMSEV